MSDDYDRLVATVRLQERVRIAMMLNEWMGDSSTFGFMSSVSRWIDEVTREAKAATSGESAKNSACTDGDSE